MGEDPVPARYSDAKTRESTAATPPAKKRANGIKPLNRKALLAALARDPSLKFSETGRQVVRWLQHYTVNPDNLQNVATGVPDHWAMPIATLARNCATAWLMLAEQLEQRPSGGDTAHTAAD